jgi:transcriptional regulator GlxA family with amidase domain
MRVAVLVLDGVFDTGLSVVLDTLETANELATGAQRTSRYDVTLCGLRRAARTHHGLRLDLAPVHEQRPDVVIVPALGAKTVEAVSAALEKPEVADARDVLRDWSKAGARVAGACTATFVLASSGILDGGSATTTWWLAPLFRERFREVTLDDSKMVVESSRVVTAGAALAHVDLALWLIRRRSPSLADQTARYLVFDARPSQSTFVMSDHLAHADPIVHRFEQWARRHITDFDLAEAARRVGTSARTLEGQQGVERPGRELVCLRHRDAEGPGDVDGRGVVAAIDEGGDELEALRRAVDGGGRCEDHRCGLLLRRRTCRQTRSAVADAPLPHRELRENPGSRRGSFYASSAPPRTVPEAFARTGDLGGVSHLIDTALWLTGASPSWVHAELLGDGSTAMHDGLATGALVTLVHGPAAEPVLWGRWAASGEGWELATEGGYVQALGGWKVDTVRAFTDGRAVEIAAPLAPETGRREPWAEAHVEVARAFLRAIKGPRSEALATFEEGALVQRVIAAARRANAEGRRVAFGQR